MKLHKTQTGEWLVAALALALGLLLTFAVKQIVTPDKQGLPPFEADSTVVVPPFPTL
jgi:hypothetical protein